MISFRGTALKALLVCLLAVWMPALASAACVPTITFPSYGATVATPVTVAVAASGCTGWPGTSGFVRVEQTQPFPIHYDGNPGTSTTTVNFGTGNHTIYVTLWLNSVTQMGTASNNVVFTVGAATSSPVPTSTVVPTATPTCSCVCPTATVSAAATTTPIPTVTPVPTSTPTAVAGVMRAFDFLETLGVTSHIVQQGLTPAQFDTDMAYLPGIRHVRDDFTCDGCDPHNWNATFFIPEHQNHGLTFVGMPYAANGATIGVTFLQWDQLGAAGALFAVEGPNEPNNQPFTYNGIACNQGSTFQGCVNFQHDLLAATRADANTASLPMFSITEVGAEPDNVGLQFISGFADYANLHNYVDDNSHATNQNNHAWAAEAPGGAEGCCYDGMDGEFFNKTFSKQFPASLDTNIPRVTTETGWDDIHASADYKGKSLVNVLLSAAKRGWRYTFLYQLQDDRDTFGLFTAASQPKLAATYIHNMLTILADNSSNFTPVVLEYSIPNEPATVHDLLMQKSSGVYELAVWDDRPIGVAAETVTINLPRTMNGSVYDVTLGTAPVAAFNGAAQIQFSMTDHAMILEMQ